jgi:hypothetical protein
VVVNTSFDTKMTPSDFTSGESVGDENYKLQMAFAIYDSTTLMWPN